MKGNDMLSIIADAMNIATRTETEHDVARRRYVAKQEARRRDEEYYRRWIKTSASRW